jgi:2-keto-4-pentenoate hydratase/2-oxohepta-3-ene-1,7-dioic acid hydratase in catechol pathway
VSTLRFGGRPLRPGKIVCVGRNYAAHIEELGNAVPEEMVVFNKPPSAIGDLLRAEYGEPLHYEGEIALLIMAGAVAAVGFGMDLTRRALQSRLKALGLPWERAKAFDGAALFSEFVPFSGDCTLLALELRVDGALRQSGGVSAMLYPPERILDELARFTTLEDGDIVMTGTPAGVGPVQAGSLYEGRVLLAGETLVEAAWTAI